MTITDPAAIIVGDNLYIWNDYPLCECTMLLYQCTIHLYNTFYNTLQYIYINVQYI